MNSNDFLKEGIGEDAQAMALDHEVQMARQECYHAAEDAITLHKLLRHMSEQQGLEGWVSAKITLAADYLNTVREHLEYQLMSGAEQAAPISVVTVAEGTITQEDLAAITEAPVTKKPQPYNDPKWAKNLPKEKLDALAGARRKKEPGVVSQAKFAEIVNRPKMQAALKRKGMAEGQLNEYLVRAGMPVKDVLALNLFQDTSPDGQEGMADDPRWSRLMKKYQPIANMLAKKIMALGKNRRLSDAEAEAVEEVWYDGSDAYEDMEVEYLADYYNMQIETVEAIIAGELQDEEFGDLEEADPHNFDSDEDYYRARNAPAKRRSAPSDYPYSPEEDDAYFREIFRKKREAAKKAEQDKGQVNELDKKTLGSYVKKATNSMDTHAYHAYRHQDDSDYDKKEKRKQGISKAVDRLTKEQGVAKGSLNEFAPVSGPGGDNYEDDLHDILMVYIMRNEPGLINHFGKDEVDSVVANMVTMGTFTNIDPDNKEDLADALDKIIDILNDDLPNPPGVAEGEEMSTFSALKDWRVWDVHVFNNFYRGKYADYGPRLYSVVASSPEEARQVIINNADYVLQDLLSRKLQNGKKVLPRSSALPIEDKRVGKAQPGTITTMGLKKMLTPDGVQSFKFAGGKIVDGAHVAGGEQVAEKRTCGISQGIREMSAGSVAGVVNPTPKNKAKVGSLFGGTYKQKKAAK